MIDHSECILQYFCMQPKETDIYTCIHMLFSKWEIAVLHFLNLWPVFFFSLMVTERVVPSVPKTSVHFHVRTFSHI